MANQLQLNIAEYLSGTWSILCHQPFISSLYSYRNVLKSRNYSTRSLGPLLWEYGNKCVNGLQRQIHCLWNLLQLGGEGWGWGMGVPPGRMSDPGLSLETAMCHALPHFSSLPHRPLVSKHPSLWPTSLWLGSVLAKGPEQWYHCWHSFHWKVEKYFLLPAFS